MGDALRIAIEQQKVVVSDWEVHVQAPGPWGEVRTGPGFY
jgi:hypothetical protein